MWALGCLLYSFCYGSHPFANATQLQIVNANVRYPPTAPDGRPVNAMALAIVQALLQQQVRPCTAFSASCSSRKLLTLTCPLRSQPLLRPNIFQVKAAVEHVLAGGSAATLPALTPLAHPNPSPATPSTAPSLPTPPPGRLLPQQMPFYSPPLLNQPTATPPASSSWSPVVFDATPAQPRADACQAAASAPPTEWAHFDDDDAQQQQQPEEDRQQRSREGSVTKSAVVAAGVNIPTGSERDGCGFPTQL
jgi:hypothetical protein